MDDSLKEFLQSPVILKALSSSTTLSDFLNLCNSQNYNISNQTARNFLKIPSDISDTDSIVFIIIALQEILQQKESTTSESEELQTVSGGINYLSAYQSGFVPVSFTVANSLGQTVSNTISQVQAANYSEQLDQYKVSQRQRIDDYKKSLLN